MENEGGSGFHSLFQPGRIGRLKLNNRLIMAAMGNALADSGGSVTEAMLDYYRVRVAGGVGMVITQFAAVNPQDVLPYNLSLHDDQFIPGLRRLVEVIHQAGIPACVQLMHPGPLFLLLKSTPAEQVIKVPSLTPLLPKDRPYRVLSPDDIEAIIRDFVAAARRAKASGADALELHACHGCLLSAFLSPAVNRRQDEYGGSPQNRARLVQRIITQIKNETGREFPLIVRINADDGIPQGVSPAEVTCYAEILGAAGVDGLSLSSGFEYWSTLMAPSYLTPPGLIIPLAEQVKTRTRLPVIVAGKINPALAARTLTGNQADFVALGRPLLADPGLPNKLQSGRLKEIRQCLYCNNCLRTSWRSCTVNPFLYREAGAVIKPTEKPRRIMVVGAGLAGLQAALLCRMKGHEVSLYEKAATAGGQWKTACALPGKGSYISILNSLKRELEDRQVKVVYNCEVNRALVESLKPDTLILATGAVPQTPAIPGLAGLKVVQSSAVIEGQAAVSGRVVMLGGTLPAMETALLLAEKGLAVSLVSTTALGGRKGPDDLITFRGLLGRLAMARVPLYLNATLLEAAPGSLQLRFGEEMLALPCDTLVLAVGVQPADQLAAELKGIAADVYTIGDCVMPGNAAQATFSAARLALKL